MKTLQGTVTSLKNLNTARVTVETKWQHPLYKKFIKKSKNYACDYSDLKLEIGDKVVIEACKPVSKTKFYRVASKVEVR
jgi:small subunit ribosomal protein S17